jgi:hypothetical protein
MRKPKNFTNSTDSKRKKNFNNDQSPPKVSNNGFSKIPIK